MPAKLETTVAAYVNGKPLVNCELQLDYQQIDITTEFERDPDWTFIDAAGHFHAWTKDGELPTLNGITVEMPCNGQCGNDYDEPCEGYTRTEYHCRVCDEIVEPGYRRTTERKYMPGRMIWSVVVTGRHEDLWPFYSSGELVSFWMMAKHGTQFGFGVVDAIDVSSDSPLARATIHAASELGSR